MRVVIGHLHVMDTHLTYNAGQSAWSVSLIHTQLLSSICFHPTSAHKAQNTHTRHSSCPPPHQSQHNDKSKRPVGRPRRPASRRIHRICIGVLHRALGNVSTEPLEAHQAIFYKHIPRQLLGRPVDTPTWW
mmetsp:Transcript_13402/g.38630  ORF Transcript_13402/g.38630 Transcript_13402/m.38630 type:complete len:131 (+) Transcript_13402:2258-2650(+)